MAKTRAPTWRNRGMLQAADIAPSFLDRQDIKAEDLARVQEPCVVLEYEGRDSDGEAFFVFTVGGWLEGKPLGNGFGGCTVGGDTIIVSGMGRDDAKLVASMGLQDTIDALHAEADRYIEAQAALAKLNSVSPERRLELAIAKPADKSDEFETDTNLIRPLRGDDIVLSGS